MARHFNDLNFHVHSPYDGGSALIASIERELFEAAEGPEDVEEARRLQLKRKEAEAAMGNHSLSKKSSAFRDMNDAQKAALIKNSATLKKPSVKKSTLKKPAVAKIATTDKKVKALKDSKVKKIGGIFLVRAKNRHAYTDEDEDDALSLRIEGPTSKTYKNFHERVARISATRLTRQQDVSFSTTLNWPAHLRPSPDGGHFGVQRSTNPTRVGTVEHQVLLAAGFPAPGGSFYAMCLSCFT